MISLYRKARGKMCADNYTEAPRDEAVFALSDKRMYLHRPY